jgi:hypothetical protein
VILSDVAPYPLLTARHVFKSTGPNPTENVLSVCPPNHLQRQGEDTNEQHSTLNQEEYIVVIATTTLSSLIHLKNSCTDSWWKQRKMRIIAWISKVGRGEGGELGHLLKMNVED